MGLSLDNHWRIASLAAAVKHPCGSPPEKSVNLSDLAKGITIRQRVLRNTVSNYIGQFIARGIWFLLTPFLLHHLGTVDYGLWVLTGSVVAYGSLLNLGIGGAIIKYVAEYRARGESEQARSLIATALCLYTLLGATVIILSIVLGLIFPSLFNVPAEKQSTTTWLVLLMGLGVGLSIPCSMPGAVLRGLQRYDIANLISIIGALLSATLTVTMLLLGGGVVGIVAINIPVTLVMQVPHVWLIRRVAPNFRLGWHGAKWSFIRPLLGFSSSLFVLDLAGHLQTKTDELVIGAFLPVKVITPYAIARGLSEVLLVLTNQFTRVLLPLASELHAEKDGDRLRTLYIAGTRLTLVIALLIGCPLIIFRESILTLWIGAPYAEYGHLVLILALSCLIETSQWPAGSILQGIARHRVMAAMAICSGLGNLVLSVVLVRPFGLTGVALGTLIPTAIVCLAVFLPYSMRVIGASKAQVSKEVFLPALLPAIPAALVLYLLQHVLEPSSLLSIMVVTGIGFLVYTIGYLNFGASEVERQTCRSFALNAIRLVEARLKQP
jgi:O-antigen/teichoic acid export membrane protein